MSDTCKILATTPDTVHLSIKTYSNILKNNIFSVHLKGRVEAEGTLGLGVAGSIFYSQEKW